MSPPCALVIDDAAEMRELYAFMLRLEGLVVMEARNGLEGLSRAIDAQPDVIITDLSMPIMDGWETIRRLKADERTRHIPIIACSGGEWVEDTQPPEADVLLPKPCPLDALVAEVRRLLPRQAA
jgi:two-component system cell cycle response regulator DivK